MNKIIPIHSAARYRRSIMIVDDQATSRTILRSLIQRVDSKAKLYVFDETSAADAFCRTRVMDFVFTDYKLTKSNGIELIEKISRYPTCCNTIFVGVTASDELSVRSAFIRVGAGAVLSKPVGILEIQRVLRPQQEPCGLLNLDNSNPAH